MKALSGGEYGFLLLTSTLGDPDRKPMTVAQFRELTHRARHFHPEAPDRDMEIGDLKAMGYDAATARHVLDLLAGDQLMSRYLQRAWRHDIVPLTRATKDYPAAVRVRLGLDSPGCIWARGDLSLLNTRKIALVGSRDLHPVNELFAARVGREAACQGITLVSGNARGADKAAQNACLAAGGRVISVIADSLLNVTPETGVLYLSECGYDEAFTSQRALSRNRVIHALAEKTFVAQCTNGKGGTWDGTSKNLRFGWSPVFCFDDGSQAMKELACMGAELIGLNDLEDIASLQGYDRSFLEE